MENYTKTELEDALRAVHSIIHKCEKAQEKFPQGNSHHTLLKNRLNAMYISKSLIADALFKMKQLPASQQSTSDDYDVSVLFQQLHKLHITDLGIDRIRKNLQIEVNDVVEWCRNKIKNTESHILRRGKNWYITVDDCQITVNAHSYTIITAHRIK